MCKQKKPFFFTFTSLQWLPTKQTIQPQSPPRSQWTSIQRNLSSIRSPNRSNQHQNGIQSMGARIRFKSRYLQCVERSLGVLKDVMMNMMEKEKNLFGKIDETKRIL
eukprot:191680_1